MENNLPFTEFYGYKLVNLCPHDLHIFGADDQMYTIPKSGQIARVQVNQESVGSLGGEVPINKTKYGAVENLPNQKDLYVYLVSTMVAQVVCRHDVLSPDTFNGVIRDEKGQILGVTKLQSFYPGIWDYSRK